MLAEKYEGNINPQGWYMSEKLDGVRCFWNGKNLYSRNGNVFYPPDWFKDLLPKDLALDGELWTKRDDF
jgi:DNA ligase-1